MKILNQDLSTPVVRRIVLELDGYDYDVLTAALRRMTTSARYYADNFTSRNAKITPARKQRARAMLATLGDNQ